MCTVLRAPPRSTRHPVLLEMKTSRSVESQAWISFVIGASNTAIISTCHDLVGTLAAIRARRKVLRESARRKDDSGGQGCADRLQMVRAGDDKGDFGNGIWF